MTKTCFFESVVTNSSLYLHGKKVILNTASAVVSSQTHMVLQFFFPFSHPHLSVMPASHSIIQSISRVGSGGRSVKYAASPKNGTNLAAFRRSDDSADPTTPRRIRSSSTNQPWNAAKMTRSTMKELPTLSILSKSRKLAYLAPKSPYSGRASNPHSIDDVPTPPRSNPNGLHSATSRCRIPDISSR